MKEGQWDGVFGRDTSPQAEAFLIATYRRMSVSEKLQRVSTLTRAVQELALLDIRRRHPTANDEELRLRLASRWLDRETMVRWFKWDPQKMGF
jgi:hypothetical protein